MQVKMPTGRVVLNPFAEPAQEKNVAVASDGREVAIAAVDNTTEGVCPKCRATMSTAFIPAGQVYYCGTCRVATPISEE